MFKNTPRKSESLLISTHQKVKKLIGEAVKLTLVNQHVIRLKLSETVEHYLKSENQQLTADDILVCHGEMVNVVTDMFNDPMLSVSDEKKALALIQKIHAFWTIFYQERPSDQSIASLARLTEVCSINQGKAKQSQMARKKVATENAAKTYFQKGEKAFQNEKYVDAVEYYEGAITVNANLGEAYFGLTRCYIRLAALKRDEFSRITNSKVAVAKKQNVEIMNLYEKAEENFKRGVEKQGELFVVSADVFWELAQFREKSGDLKGSEQYYTMAFQRNQYKFCECYLYLAKEEKSDMDMLMRNRFIRYSEEFESYFESRKFIGEKVEVYFRGAEAYSGQGKLVLLIQQLLLAFVCSATKLQAESVFNAIRLREKDFSLDIFQDDAQELLPKELSDMKAGYIKLIRQYLINGCYGEGVRKYELIQNQSNFSEFFTEDFLVDIANARTQIEQKEWEVRGNLNFVNKKYEIALEYYKKLMAINSQIGSVYLKAGICCRQLGEAKMLAYRFQAVPAPTGAGCMSIIETLLSPEEEILYKQAEQYFVASLNLLTEPSAIANIYRELGYLFELKFENITAFDYFQKSFGVDRGAFYEFYIDLARKEYQKKTYQSIFHFSLMLHHEYFQEYNGRNNSNDNGNYVSNLYYMCGVIYHTKLLYGAAIQQYLLAFFYSKTDNQINYIYQKLNQLFFRWLGCGEGQDAFFKNIFNITTIEELHDIKIAYIQWIRHDLEQDNYDMAVKRFELVAQNPVWRMLIGPELFSQMGSIHEMAGDFDLAATYYSAANALRDSVKAQLEEKRVVKAGVSLCVGSSSAMYAGQAYDAPVTSANSGCNLL